MHTISTVVFVFATFCCDLAAVDKSLQYSLSDAREALVNSAIDMLNAYSGTLTSSQQMGALLCPPNMRLLPLLVLALLKFVSLWIWKVDLLIFNINFVKFNNLVFFTLQPAFRSGTSTRLDERVHALELCKNLPLEYLIQEVHPDLYPVHQLDDQVKTSCSYCNVYQHSFVATRYCLMFFSRVLIMATRLFRNRLSCIFRQRTSSATQRSLWIVTARCTCGSVVRSTRSS